MKNKKFMNLGFMLFGLFLSFNTKIDTHYQENRLNTLIEIVGDKNEVNYDDIELLNTVSLNQIQKDLKNNLTLLDTVSTKDIEEDFSSPNSLNVFYQHKKGAKHLAPKKIKLNFKKMV
jgi:hypothetical protein